MVLQIWCVLQLFECQLSEIVTSKVVVCKQLKKNVNAEARVKNIKDFRFNQKTITSGYIVKCVLYVTVF